MIRLRDLQKRCVPWRFTSSPPLNTDRLRDSSIAARATQEAVVATASKKMQDLQSTAMQTTPSQLFPLLKERVLLPAVAEHSVYRSFSQHSPWLQGEAAEARMEPLVQQVKVDQDAVRDFRALHSDADRGGNVQVLDEVRALRNTKRLSHNALRRETRDLEK